MAPRVREEDSRVRRKYWGRTHSVERGRHVHGLTYSEFTTPLAMMIMSKLYMHVNKARLNRIPR